MYKERSFHYSRILEVLLCAIFKKDHCDHFYRKKGISKEEQKIIDLRVKEFVFKHSEILRKEEILSNVFKIVFRNIKDIPEFAGAPNFPLGSFYKYISNEATYVHECFDGNVSFVMRDRFDDIFDSAIKHYDFYIKNHLRFLCLSQDKDNRLLWGTYGNKFQGFCFEYFANDLANGILYSAKRKEIVSFCYGQIEYDKKLTFKDLIYSDRFENQPQPFKDAIDMFLECFHKDSCWKEQNEYRIIAYKKNAREDDFLKIKVQPYAVYTYDFDLMKPKEWNS